MPIKFGLDNMDKAGITDTTRIPIRMTIDPGNLNDQTHFKKACHQSNNHLMEDYVWSRLINWINFKMQRNNFYLGSLLFRYLATIVSKSWYIFNFFLHYYLQNPDRYNWWPGLHLLDLWLSIIRWILLSKSDIYSKLLPRCNSITQKPRINFCPTDPPIHPNRS